VPLGVIVWIVTLFVSGLAGRKQIIVVKDGIVVKDAETTDSSKLLWNWEPPRNPTPLRGRLGVVVLALGALQ
jgi:hypothetical protein